MRTFFTVVLSFVLSLRTFAQQDSLNSADKELLSITSIFIKQMIKKSIADQRNDNKSAFKNKLGHIAKTTLQRSFENGIQLLSRQGNHTGFSSFSNNFIQQNQSQLYGDIKSASRATFDYTLQNALTKITEQAFDIDVDKIIDLALTDQDITFTDIYAKTSIDKMRKIIKPIAEKGFKIAGGKKLQKQLNQQYKKNKLGTAPSLLDNFIENTVQTMLSATKKQEIEAKKNPLEMLFNFIK